MVSTIYPHRGVDFQTHLKKCFGDHEFSILANPKLVPAHNPVSSRLSSGNPNHLAVPDSSNRPKSQTSAGTKTQIDSRPFIRHAVKMSNTSDEIGRVICDS